MNHRHRNKQMWEAKFLLQFSWKNKVNQVCLPKLKLKRMILFRNRIKHKLMMGKRNVGGNAACVTYGMMTEERLYETLRLFLWWWRELSSFSWITSSDEVSYCCNRGDDEEGVGSEAFMASEYQKKIDRLLSLSLSLSLWEMREQIFCTSPHTENSKTRHQKTKRNQKPKKQKIKQK